MPDTGKCKTWDKKNNHLNFRRVEGSSLVQSRLIHMTIEFVQWLFLDSASHLQTSKPMSECLTFEIFIPPVLRFLLTLQPCHRNTPPFSNEPRNLCVNLVVCYLEVEAYAYSQLSKVF